MVALVISLALWFVAKNVDTTVEVNEPTFIIGNVMTIEPIECRQAWLCVFNVTGEESILGRSVLVNIEGIRAATWGAVCNTEDHLGERATSFMWELLATADNVTLVRPYKVEGNPVIHGTILVDGVSIVRKMIDLGASLAPGERVNWCKPPKKIEV